MTDREIIRTEILRMKEENNKSEHVFDFGVLDACNHMLTFIDSMSAPSPATVPVASASGTIPSPDPELERTADGYAWSHDTIGVHRDTFATTDVPPDKMVRVPVADEIRTAVLFGARWQQRRDIELIHRAHMQGMERMRDQLMQGAVVIETSMMNDDTDDLVPVIGDMRDRGFKFGDRVKLIIIKEN